MILVTDIIHKKLHVKPYNCIFNGKQIKTHSLKIKNKTKQKKGSEALIRLAKNKNTINSKNEVTAIVPSRKGRKTKTKKKYIDYKVKHRV